MMLVTYTLAYMSVTQAMQDGHLPATWASSGGRYRHPLCTRGRPMVSGSYWRFVPGLVLTTAELLAPIISPLLRSAIDAQAAVNGTFRNGETISSPSKGKQDGKHRLPLYFPTESHTWVLLRQSMLLGRTSFTITQMERPGLSTPGSICIESLHPDTT